MIRVGLVIAFLLASTGCDDSQLDPRTLIRQTRLLAVRADPPVVSLGDQATLEALVVDAEGSAFAPDILWRVCDPWRFVLDPDRDCPAESALPLDGVLDIDAVLDAFPPPDGAGGLAPDGPPVDEQCGDEPLELGVPIVAEAIVDGQRIVAIRYVPLRLETAGRSNPAVESLLLDGLEAPTVVEPGREYSLTVRMEPDSLDTVCVDADPTPEAVRVHLYTTDGELGDSSIDLDASDSATPEDAVTTWLAPASETTTLWAIAIDGDGGVDWHHVVVRAR